MLEQDYYFLEGLHDFQLRELYKQARTELKKRGLFTLNKETGSLNLVPKYEYSHSRRTPRNRKSKGLIIADRNNLNAGKYHKPKRWKNEYCPISDFMHEDWRFLFPNANDEERRYYVYYHSDPTSCKQSFGDSAKKDGVGLRFNGTPFYIGKGTGDRYKRLSNRSTSHINLVNNYKDRGYSLESICYVIQEGLTELEAFELESKLITFLGCRAEITNSKKHFTGFKNGLLINSDIGKRPDWIEDIIRTQLGIINTIK